MRIERFPKLLSESGAVTVDWVVLTAAVTGLGLATLAVLGPALGRLAGEVEGEVSTTDVARAYSPYDPDAWNALLDATWDTYKDETDASVLHEMSKNITDEYRVIIGSEDNYAALQIVLEHKGGTLTDGWPDYRYF